MRSHEFEKFEDNYGSLTELSIQKRSGKAITSKPRPKSGNIVDLMDAL
jgi:non-homologous end joining protein Ku